MDSLQLRTRDGRLHFHPGETLSGTAEWQLADAPAEIGVRLVWQTRGRAREDASTVQTVSFENPLASDSRPFSFTLPDSPYSFTGQLVSLIWALELVPKPERTFERVEISIAPGDGPVQLPSI